MNTLFVTKTGDVLASLPEAWAPAQYGGGKGVILLLPFAGRMAEYTVTSIWDEFRKTGQHVNEATRFVTVERGAVI